MTTRTPAFTSISPLVALVVLTVVGLLAVQRADAAPAAMTSATATAAKRCPATQIRIGAKAVLGVKRDAYCLPVATGASGRTRVDPLYGHAATEVISFFATRRSQAVVRQAIVICWSKRDWRELDRLDRRLGGDGFGGVHGYVYMPQRVINLSPDVCARLDAVAYLRQQPLDVATAMAVNTLAHEAMHVAGVESESFAECFAMQLTEHAASRLGTTRQYGYKLGALHFKHWWHLHGGTEYDTSGCANRGPLDLYPETDVWP